MSLRKIVFTLAAVLTAVGCASADGQSSPTESTGASPAAAAPSEHAAEPSERAAEPGERSTELSYLAQCNARCVAAYDRALSSCEGDSVCLCFANQSEGACLAACVGRPYYRHAC